MNRKPIATAITFGRRYAGQEASQTDDWHVCISGYNEIEIGDGTVVRSSLQDIHLDLSQVADDPAVAVAFPAVYDIVVRIMQGQLVPSTGGTR